MEKQIEQLYTPILLYVKNRVGNQEDAEDLTQEVFYKLSKSNHEKVTSVKNWVYTIARNSITDYYRKRKIIAEDIQESTFLPEEEERTVVEELSEYVSACIQYLPEEYREIMRLSELENVPQKEIAERLNMNYTTVRSKVQRGRKQLKRLFMECCTIVQGGKGSIMGFSPNCGKEGEGC